MRQDQVARDAKVQEGGNTLEEGSQAWLTCQKVFFCWVERH